MFRAPIFVLALCAMYVFAADVEKYPDTYDYINIDEMLGNERLRDQYYKCFMDTAPCKTPDSKFFRVHLPEGMATQCARCTDRQKVMFDQVSSWFAEHETVKWNALVAKLLEDAKKLKLEKEKLEKS